MLCRTFKAFTITVDFWTEKFTGLSRSNFGVVLNISNDLERIIKDFFLPKDLPIHVLELK